MLRTVNLCFTLPHSYVFRLFLLTDLTQSVLCWVVETASTVPLPPVCVPSFFSTIMTCILAVILYHSLRVHHTKGREQSPTQTSPVYTAQYCHLLTDGTPIRTATRQCDVNDKLPTLHGVHHAAFSRIFHAPINISSILFLLPVRPARSVWFFVH